MKEEILKLIKEILFPVFCVECGKEGKWWCEECLKKLKVEEIKSCPVCGVKTDRGEPCKKCQAVSYLDGITAFFSYEENSPLAKLLKQFKYQWARDMVGVWGKIFAPPSEGGRGVLEKFKDNFAQHPPLNPPPKGDLKVFPTILPIPLHPRRQRERGFNQAEVFAKMFYEELKQKGWQVNFDNLSLRRIRNTRQQARLTGQERRENVKGAFVWTKKQPAPRVVLLVDDVFTTGSTTQECAKVLKENGAEFVWGVVVMRG